MFRLGVALVSIIILWKWGDWRNWKLYYPTILFFILGDFIYMYLTFQKPLWILESPLVGRTFSSLIVAFIMYPAVVMTYLPHFPKKNLKHQILYIVVWTFFFVGFEYYALKIRDITHYNGWNLWWSTLFDSMIFILLWIHYHKPLLGISIAAVAGTCFMLIFKIPLPR